MAVWNGREHTQQVLAAAEHWKQRCFVGDGSVFTDRSLWSADKLSQLLETFRENPLHDRRTFVEKLEAQLRGADPDLQQLAAEVVWFLLLFVANLQMGPVAKRQRVERIWALSAERLPSTPWMEDECLAGLAKPGAAFMTRIPDEFDYAVATVCTFKSLDQGRRKTLLNEPFRFAEWLDQQEGSERRGFRHMLLYFLFPAEFERISSGRHKRQIREAFQERIPAADINSSDWSMTTTDRALKAIRTSFEREYGKSELDFYVEPLRELWLGSESDEESEARLTSDRRFWIEKTLVTGRADRESGDHAAGRALWSPQRSKNGGDIYSNMREVRPGDVVFHLTDNKGITGVSIAAAPVDDTFQGLSGTSWEGPAYRVELIDFQQLDPPLPREAFLETEPFATELRELARSGAKGLFYNSARGLNQGAYLTEATPTLLNILERAYEAFAGKALPYMQAHPAQPEADVSVQREVTAYSIADALGELFLDEEEVHEILLIWRAKKNLILQGPPGVGKSFAAQRLAFALMGAKDRSRLGFVQFHQSYSYEDFVEGFRPTESGFDLRPGKFVEFCRTAEANPNLKHVFIIDEINRGNLSKILGELMLLIEPDKRDPQWSMPLASGKVPFHVPPNVFLMGLMNTADRSLAVVDYALRRRFAFVDLTQKLESAKFRQDLARRGIDGEVAGALIGRTVALNREIVADTTNLGPGFAIGHSFFCAPLSDGEESSAWYQRIIRTEILPLLREYWFDNAEKVKSWEDQLLAPL